MDSKDNSRKKPSVESASHMPPEGDPSALKYPDPYFHKGDIDKRTVKARIMSQPEIRSASVIQRLDSNLDIDFLAAEMREQIAQVHGGCMARAEAMLITQAHTLDALFANLSRRAINHMDEGYGEAFERHMKLALRAQSQCRATLETLSDIKNPPVIYAKQANIAHGPQQVNNGVPPCDALRTGEMENPPNELGEHSDELSPNASSQSLVGPAMPGAETLAEIHRTKDG